MLDVKSCLVEVVLKELSPETLEQSNFVATMQVAMLFESAGRKSEAGYAAFPKDYESYRQESRKAFSKYAKESHLKCWEDCDTALEEMFNEEPSSSDQVAQVRAVFEICHDLDMMRCTYEMKPKFDRIEKLLK